MPGRGPGGHGGMGSLATAAEVLGTTVDELRTALEGGQSLAQVAADKGVDKQTLIDALVTSASEHLDGKVASGDLTQAEADEKKGELTERITAQVERQGLPGHPGRGDGASRRSGEAPGDDSAAGESDSAA